MGKNLFLSAIFLFLGFYLKAQMILVYDTNLSWGTTITLPLNENVNVFVDWGDGTNNSYLNWGYFDHTYAEEGIYTVTISGKLGHFGGQFFYPNAEKLTEVISFGELGLTSLNGAFLRASNLVKVPSSLPSSVKSLVMTFNSATSFNHPIGEWDVSNITDMSFAFNEAISFNQDISNWDVGNVTRMNSMFYGCTSFNQDIGMWDVGNVTDMNQMFALASSFNQYIGDWDVSSVTNIFGMFSWAESFNQDIGKWDVGNVGTMQTMFQAAYSFNQDIGGWNVGKVEDMHGMFWGAESFDQDLGGWDMSNVASFNMMLADCKLSTANYNSLLIGWATQELKPGLNFNAGYSQHSPGEADDAKFHIMVSYRWSIQDGGISKLPAISTASVSQITPSTAVSGGKVTADGGFDVTERGIVWHTETDPTTNFNIGITQNGSGIGSYESNLDELVIGTTYYVRAYATNSQGTSCGNTVKFKSTKELYLEGDFSVHNKIYDGTNSALLLENNLGLVGVLDEYNDVSIDTMYVRFDDSQVGDEKIVSIISAVLKGEHANNYMLSLANAPTAIAKIEPRELRLEGTFKVADKLYDATPDAIITENNLKLITPLNSDDVSLKDVVANFENESEGIDKKVILVEASLQGNDSNNYSLTLDDSPVSSASIAMPSDSHMRMVFDTSLSDGTTISLPFGYGNLNATVYWGDGLSNTYTISGKQTHTYATEGIYTVTIAGSCESFGFFPDDTDKTKLVEIISFGDLGITSFTAAFMGATNLVSVPDFLPASVTSTPFMFLGTTSFNYDIGGWDVSNVTRMFFMFSRSAFNQDIGDWDVSNVTDMRYMFDQAHSFNQDISKWDVSNVRDMGGMFSNATSFNQNIGGWDVGKVTDLSDMFSGSKLSTANYDSLLIGWATRPLQQGVIFNAGNSQYSSGDAAQARQLIINNYNWTIIDGGLDPTINITEIGKPNHLHVYPNPFQNFIKVESDAEISKMELFNTTGQLVAIAYNRASLENILPEDGIYFLRVEFINHPPQVVKVVKK